MDNIKNIIQSVIKDIPVKGAENKASIEDLWREAAGEINSKNTRLSSLDNGVLTVFVDSSSRIYALSAIQAKILKHIQTDFPEVKDIKFRIGKTDG